MSETDIDLLAAAVLGDPGNLAITRRFGQHIVFAINQALEEAQQRGIGLMVSTAFVCSELSLALGYMMAAMIHDIAHRVSQENIEKAYAMGLEQIPAMLLPKMTRKLPELVQKLRDAQKKHDAECKAKKETGNAQSSQPANGS